MLNPTVPLNFFLLTCSNFISIKYRNLIYSKLKKKKEKIKEIKGDDAREID